MFEAYAENQYGTCFRMRRQKWGWIGHTLRTDEKCIARKAKEWNPLISAGRLSGRP